MTEVLNTLSTVGSRTQDVTGNILKIAIHAVGGQGGGVLANWISDLATLGGYAVQMTSVAGVAQRTGATIYYIEMAKHGDRKPVFALSPAPGDVDILIAAELMEAGRALTRGFVSPDRTTVIASTHRVLAVDEKVIPGDGRADSSLVLDKVKAAAFESVCFDMEVIAGNAGSMISASLFGALAKSGSTPFATDLFEQVIRNSGRGVDASLAAFTGALEYTKAKPVINIKPVATEPSVNKESKPSPPTGPAGLLQQWDELNRKIDAMPPDVQAIAGIGLQHVVDYQDIEYGDEYLQYLGKFLSIDTPAQHYKLSQTAAKYIANAMCYDDIIRVADLKTRASRNQRLRLEQQTTENQIVQVTEYFHPRAQEICGTLPAWLGGWIENSSIAFSLLDKLVNKGRRVRTDKITGFGTLWLVSAMKPGRRKLLRHHHEKNHLTQLTDTAFTAAQTDYQLAVEVLTCQRVIKGYSDTHARGQSKFGVLMESVPGILAGNQAVTHLVALRDIALNNESAEFLQQQAILNEAEH